MAARAGFAAASAIVTPRADLITIGQQLPHLPRARGAYATLGTRARRATATGRPWSILLAKGR